MHIKISESVGISMLFMLPPVLSSEDAGCLQEETTLLPTWGTQVGCSRLLLCLAGTRLENSTVFQLHIHHPLPGIAGW